MKESEGPKRAPQPSQGVTAATGSHDHEDEDREQTRRRPGNTGKRGRGCPAPPSQASGPTAAETEALTPLPSHGPMRKGDAGAHGQNRGDLAREQHHPSGLFLSNQGLSPRD